MMKIRSVLITGANGQLGRELRELSHLTHYRYYFTDRTDFSLADFRQMRKFFESHELDYCVNCAAYTAVDKAESEPENAFRINAEAVGELANLCREFQVKLIHISTDYVYDESLKRPLLEDDPVKPLNVYGASKLKGDELALRNKDAVVIRTSWVFSAYGNNFVKTMLRLFAEKNEISVVDDQWGSPTYARDLAEAILILIEQAEKGTSVSGILNFSNTGVTNWHLFASEIRRLSGSSCRINPTTTAHFKTPARRPLYSVMNTSRISEKLGLSIRSWQDAVRECLQLL